MSQHAQLHQVLTQIEADLGTIEVLIVNTSAGPFKSFEETTQEEMDLALSTGPGTAQPDGCDDPVTGALFAFAKAVTPGMIARGRGAIGVTGATASWRGMPSTTAKAAGNCGMRAVAQSLARDMAPKGIHVFHVIIDALIDQPRTHLWCPNKPDDEFMRCRPGARWLTGCSPAAIAETYWHLANQPRSCWGFEINLVAGPCFGSMATI